MRKDGHNFVPVWISNLLVVNLFATDWFNSQHTVCVFKFDAWSFMVVCYFVSDIVLLCCKFSLEDAGTLQTTMRRPNLLVL